MRLQRQYPEQVLFYRHSRGHKSLSVDFHPAQNHVGSPARSLWREWKNTTLFDTLNGKSRFSGLFPGCFDQLDS